MLNKQLATFLFLFWLQIFPTFSQSQSFKKLPSTSKRSKNLIANCRDLYKTALTEINYLDVEVYNEVKQLYLKRTNLLIKKIESGSYIEDVQLNNLINEIKRKLETNNFLSNRKRQILIEKNPTINAYCLGDGNFSLHIGLLAKIENEDQLAFTLAHEFAHYELDHVKNRLIKVVRDNYFDQINSASKKIGRNSDMIEGLTSLKELMYSLGSYSRKDEMQADSLGLIYFTNAGYNFNEAINAIDILENSNEPKHPIGNALFDMFDFEEYPFNIDWIQPRLAAYSKQVGSSYIFPIDSLQSHPTYKLRRNALQALKPNNDNQPVPVTRIDEEITKAEFETIEANRYYRKFDQSLYLAMQLFVVYPDSIYPRNMVAKNLFLLAEAKNKGNFETFVSPFTGYYSEELRYINTFLFNISQSEIIELAYHFLQKQNQHTNEEYYYLLWKACDLSNRKKEKKEVYQMYKDYYPNAKPISNYGL